MVGPQAAKRNFRDMLPLLVVTYAAVFAFNFLESPYQEIVFPVVYAVFFALWLGSWPIRRRAAGDLLLSIKPPQNKLFAWIGWFEGAFAIILTWEFIARWSGPDRGSLSELPILIMIWLVTGLFFVFAQSRFEFRENGFCYVFRYIEWARVTAYEWEPTKPETLTLRYQPRFPLLPKFLTLKMPAAQHEEIERIAESYISRKITPLEA